jgi:glycosyltransferase involved in cell wall biosynthesis
MFFVSHATSLGGAEIGLLRLLKTLDRAKWSPHLICPPGDLHDRVLAIGIPVSPLAFPGLRRSGNALVNWQKTSAAITRIVQEGGGEVVYANSIRAMMYCLRKARSTRLIWHMHDFWLSESRPKHVWLDALLKRWLVAQADSVIVNSQATAQHLPASPKIEVLYFGLDAPATVSPKEFRQAYGLGEDSLVVGMMGRMRPWKGQRRFIETAAVVAAAVPGAQFLLVGGDVFGVGDGYQAEVEALVKEKNLGQQVIFTGQIANVFDALAAMDIFVPPGDPEPFGLVNIEAMAARKPVLAFAHGALPEIVVDDVSGYLVPPGRVDLMAEKIISLLQSMEKIRDFGDAGYQRFEHEFSSQKMAQRLDELLQKVFTTL